MEVIAYDIDAAAKAAGASRDEIEGAIRSGHLTAHKPLGKNGPSRKWRIRPADLDDWVKRGERS